LDEAEESGQNPPANAAHEQNAGHQPQTTPTFVHTTTVTTTLIIRSKSTRGTLRQRLRPDATANLLSELPGCPDVCAVALEIEPGLVGPIPVQEPTTVFELDLIRGHGHLLAGTTSM